MAAADFGLKKITDICQPFGMNLKAIGSNVFLVWGDRPSADESPEIFFTKSANSGSKFGGIKNLSNNEGDSSNPQIDVLGSNVYVAWEDNSPGNLDILFKSSWDYGAHFGKVKKLSNNEGISINPKISSSGTAVRIVWQDTTPGNNEIFFRSSADKGNTFGVIKNLSKMRESQSIRRLCQVTGLSMWFGRTALLKVKKYCIRVGHRLKVFPIIFLFSRSKQSAIFFNRVSRLLMVFPST